MLYHDPAAKTHDRFGFTLVMALALHVAIILGVGFAMQVPKAPMATRMDITLSNYATDKKVLDADYVAQSNQEASGTESSKLELSTTQLAPINSNTPQNVTTDFALPKQQQSQSSAIEIVSTVHQSDFTALYQPDDKQINDENIDGNDEQLMRQIEIASLQAKLAEVQQLYARLPRIRRASSVATKAAVDAEYLYRWQQRIEAIGNEHYPQKAREQQLVGDVQVLVSVNADGSLYQAKILSSSGISVLDEAALRIVRLASPFPPFSTEMKKSTDRLEIVRTWQFRQNQFQRLD